MSTLELSLSTAAGRTADVHALTPEKSGVAPITLTPQLSLLRLIARGDSLVYEGLDRRFGVGVVVTLLPSAREPALRASVLQKAAILANVEHANLAQVLDMATLSDGTPYIVSELVSGEGVDALVRAGHMSPALACEITRQLLGALVALHGARLPHGDIKPANVLVGAAAPDGRRSIRLVGARLGQPHRVASEGDSAAIRYWAPEQLAGAGPSVSADLYAVGLLLYEMLTQAPPLATLSVAELTQLRTQQDADEAALERAGVGTTLRRLVLSALARDPSARFASAEEMLCELHAARADESCLWMLPSRSAQQVASVESKATQASALDSAREPQSPLDSAVWDIAPDGSELAAPLRPRSGVKALLVGFSVTLAAGGALLLPLQYPFESDPVRNTIPEVAEASAPPPSGGSVTSSSPAGAGEPPAPAAPALESPTAAPLAPSAPVPESPSVARPIASSAPSASAALGGQSPQRAQITRGRALASPAQPSTSAPRLEKREPRRSSRARARQVEEARERPSRPDRAPAQAGELPDNPY